MCKNPIKIANPFYGASQSKFIKDSRLLSSREYIEVPCRHCDECLHSISQNFVTRCVFESATSHCYMITLTYDNEHLPMAEFSLSDGSLISQPYANYDHIQLLFKRLRNYGLPDSRQFRYFCVSEYGHQNHRPHFHILLFVSRLDSDTPDSVDFLSTWLYDTIKSLWSVNTGTVRNPSYEPLFTFRTRIRPNGKVVSNYDCHLVLPFEADGVTPVSLESYLNNDSDISAVASYVSKYIFKESRYSDRILRFINRHSFRKSSGEYIPREYTRLLNFIICRFRVASKGLGLGFDPRTGKKVFVRPNNPTSSNAIYRDELVYEAYQEYTELPNNVSSSVRRLLTYRPESLSIEHVMLDSSNVSLHHALSLLLLFDKNFRTWFISTFPKYSIPRRLATPKTLWVEPFSTDTTTYLPSLDCLSTRTLDAIKQAFSDIATCPTPYPSFQFLGSNLRLTLTSYYKRYCPDECILKFFDGHGYRDFDDYHDKLACLDYEFDTRKIDLFNSVASMNSYDSDFSFSGGSIPCTDTYNTFIYLDPETSNNFDIRLRRYINSYF